MGIYCSLGNGGGGGYPSLKLRNTYYSLSTSLLQGYVNQPSGHIFISPLRSLGEGCLLVVDGRRSLHVVEIMLLVKIYRKRSMSWQISRIFLIKTVEYK